MARSDVKCTTIVGQMVGCVTTEVGGGGYLTNREEMLCWGWLQDW